MSIRRVGEDAGSAEPGAVLARAETALNQGDLAAAIKEVEALPTPARDAYAGWLDDARARLVSQCHVEHARKRGARVLRRP